MNHEDSEVSLARFDRSGPMTEEEGLAPAQEDRWPVWKTATFVVVYCGLAWTLIGFGIWALVT